MPVPGPEASWREKQYYNKVMKDIKEGKWKDIERKVDTDRRNIYEQNLARNEEYGTGLLPAVEDLESLASVEDTEVDSLSLDDDTEESFLTGDDEAEESFVRDDIEVRDDDDDDDDEATHSLNTASQAAFVPAWNITTTPSTLPGLRTPNITEAVTSRNLTRRDSPPGWTALREAAWRWKLKGEGDIMAINRGIRQHLNGSFNSTEFLEAHAEEEKKKKAEAAAAANNTALTNVATTRADGTAPETNVTTRGGCNCSGGGGGNKPPKGDIDPRSECGCSKDKDKDTGDKKPQDDD